MLPYSKIIHVDKLSSNVSSKLQFKISQVTFVKKKNTPPLLGVTTRILTDSNNILTTITHDLNFSVNKKHLNHYIYKKNPCDTKITFLKLHKNFILKTIPIMRQRRKITGAKAAFLRHERAHGRAAAE